MKCQGAQDTVSKMLYSLLFRPFGNRILFRNEQTEKDGPTYEPRPNIGLTK